MKIVVLDGYTLNPGDNPWTEVEALGDLVVYDRTFSDQVIERAKDAEIVLTNKTPLSSGLLKELPNLKFIGVLATGYNIVDVEAAKAQGIVVSNVPIYGTDSVAEFVMSLILNFWKQPQLHSDLVKKGDWERSPDFSFWRTPLVEMKGKTLGLIGFGRIGKQVGTLANAFGMKVLATSRSRSAEVDYDFEWRGVDEIFAESDVVSLHCPQTSDTSGMVNRALISKMKSSAYLINTGRGGLVNEADLTEALNNEIIAGAACDVVSAEPILESNPLNHAKNLTITPHIAWATLEARQRLMAETAINIDSFIKGSPVNIVS